MKSDLEIEKDVEAELRSDPRIDAGDIAVAVKDGVVTLAGFVRGYGQKRRAEAAAKRVSGVAAVVNDIEVRLPLLHQRPDPQIARDAVETLRIDMPEVADQIRVVVRDGWVTLEGEVESNFEREEAEGAVALLRGVQGVSNLIRLKPRVVPADVKHRIEQAFERSALIDASHVSVEVNGSEVVLKGTVKSWAERDEAERAAWSVPGITNVDNQLIVRS
jgi:osmotically-inducible protein OsmY